MCLTGACTVARTELSLLHLYAHEQHRLPCFFALTAGFHKHHVVIRAWAASTLSAFSYFTCSARMLGCILEINYLLLIIKLLIHYQAMLQSPAKKV